MQRIFRAKQIFHWCSLSLYLCWPARFSSPRSLKSLINVPKVSSSHLLQLKQTKKPLWKAKYNSVSQSPNITVSPNLVVDNTTVENVVRQLWPSWNTCEANQQLKILPFQSPCTGTELRGQVTPWSPHVNIHYNTIFNCLFCQRLLWLLLRTQDMGTSQSSVCQVLEFSHFLFLDPTFFLS